MTESENTTSLIIDPLPSDFSKQLWQKLNAHGYLTVVGVHNFTDFAPLINLAGLEKINQSPNLVILKNQQHIQSFESQLRLLEPNIRVHILPAFDASLYSGLYPSSRVIAQRLAWLYQASNSQAGDIFLTTPEALLQKTLPQEVFIDKTISLSVNDEIPDNIEEYLNSLGYRPAPIVEDIGAYARRGGIIDIYSPAHSTPLRLELFGDTIESIRLFSTEDQRSLTEINHITIVPVRECLFSDENRQKIALQIKKDRQEKNIPDEDFQFISQAISHGHYFQGVDFLLPYFFKTLDTPLEYFGVSLNIWCDDFHSLNKDFDQHLGQLKKETSDSLLVASHELFFDSWDTLKNIKNSKIIDITKLLLTSTESAQNEVVEYKSYPLTEFSNQCLLMQKDQNSLKEYIAEKILSWKKSEYHVYIFSENETQRQKIKSLLEGTPLNLDFLEKKDLLWNSWKEEQDQTTEKIHIIPHTLPHSYRNFSDKYIFLKEENFFGKRKNRSAYKNSGSLDKRTQALSFSDLKVGDFVVHKLHGVATYKGLTVMPIGVVDAEFIQLEYRDGDKLYLPIYRVSQLQKFSGPNHPKILDKLGTQQWQKTKNKVKKHLRDIAADLLKLYAKRKQVKKTPFSSPDEDFDSFENHFPYEETQDQNEAINSILKDMTSDEPMDRLVCGDVGFGKTEVAMRAVFKAAQDNKQVAVIAPTTILTFQHFETFKKRFKDWPFKIAVLNRFVENKKIKETIAGLKDGSIDIVIGTHRLFSKDIDFQKLGLLVIDEEQKFGVKHKEKIRQLKANVDTLALSATPIPRTLNLSLVGIRDLSLINTPPVDRLPTRTYVTRFERETIRKAILAEVARGGQIFFLHNRVHSIMAVASELREIVPEIKIGIGHGQMKEDELEKTMVQFFNHDIDLLLCTTIIESGMDIPKANTMFIDNAHQFGLSQLYQLRGRVGRSRERAYCYLLIPPNRRLDEEALERLRIIQENTALGSGIKIAQHDLELRGAGDILGQEQSGQINSVGYELYMELLDEAIREQKGEPPRDHEIEPDINIRIPALIPDKYIPDIRLRLSYYKLLSNIDHIDEIDKIEEDLRDQFGKPPEEVINLFGVMLIRKLCKDMKIKDISSGKNIVSLSFSEQTTLSINKIVELAMKENKKYTLTPDNKLNIRMNKIEWPRILDELDFLKTNTSQ